MFWQKVRQWFWNESLAEVLADVPADVLADVLEDVCRGVCHWTGIGLLIHGPFPVTLAGKSCQCYES
jgi:hypothetical protein